MGENSNIAWTDHTLNFWHGCTKVGPGCDHCYAETFSKRVGRDIWGEGKERMRVKSTKTTIASIIKDDDAFFAEHGRRQRVFVQSMSDTFDNEVPDSWRDEVFAAIEHTPQVDFQMVTKRMPNVSKMIPTRWRSFWPPHAWLIITVCTQAEADRDIERLVNVKKLFDIKCVGLSIEPLLDRMDITPHLGHLDWIIVGGESGHGHRPMQIEWAEDIRQQCKAAGVPFFFKQDSGPKPGQRGRASEELWACKEFPA